MKKSQLTALFQRHLDTTPESGVRNTHAKILNDTVNNLVALGEVEVDPSPLVRARTGEFV